MVLILPGITAFLIAMPLASYGAICSPTWRGGEHGLTGLPGHSGHHPWSSPVAGCRFLPILRCAHFGLKPSACSQSNPLVAGWIVNL
jgi:hypothetical protein